MLNYFLRLRRKKGFTLTELIIVVAILAVLMASIATLSGPIRKMVNRTSATADSISANATMANYIENRIAYAQKLNIVCAVDADNGLSGGTLDTLFNSYKNIITTSTDSRDKAGVLIFHYEEDTAYPEESHYRIYDITITDTSGPATYGNAIDASTNQISSAYDVFSDDFYSFSKNLFLIRCEMTEEKARKDIPAAVTFNSMRRTAFMTVEVIPYNFIKDNLIYDAAGKVDTSVNQIISSSTLPNYYNYNFNRNEEIKSQYLSNANPATFTYTDETCGLSAIDIHRTGASEVATFELQNILVPDTTNLDPQITNGNTLRFKFENLAQTNPTTAGTDIAIFYYVPHY